LNQDQAEVEVNGDLSGDAEQIVHGEGESFNKDFNIGF